MAIIKEERKMEIDNITIKEVLPNEEFGPDVLGDIFWLEQMKLNAETLGGHGDWRA